MADALGTAVLDLFVNDKGMVAGMKAAQAKATTMMGGMAGAAAVGAKKLAFPIIALGGASIFMARQFNQSMTKINTLVGVSSKQVDRWRDDLLKLGPQVAKSPKELADALFFVTSAGFRGAEAIDILTMSAKASKVGLGETKVVADLVTSAMNSYGKGNLSASQATDTLVGMVRAGKAEASSFAPVLGAILPLASELGVGFNEVGGSLAQMTRLGIPATRAATALQATMSGLLKPTQQAEDTMKKYGLSSAGLRTQLKEKGLISVLKTLKKETGGNSAEMAKIFPNIRALRGVLALVGKAGGSTDEVFKQVRNSTGAMGRAWKVVSEKDGFKMDQALVKLEVASIKLGNAILPTVAMIISGLGMLAQGFAMLPGPVRGGIAAVLGIVAAIGLVLKMWPALQMFGKGLIFLIKGIGAAFTFLAANPVIAVILILVALGIALVIAYKKSETFRNIVNSAFTAVKAAVSAAYSAISTAVKAIIAAFSAVINWLKGNWKLIALIISGPFLPLVALATNAFGVRSALIGAFNAVVGAVRGAMSRVVNAVRSVVGAATAAARKVGQGIWNGVKAGAAALGGLYGFVWGKISGAIGSLASAAYNGALAIGRQFIQGIVDGAEAAWEWAKGKLAKLNPMNALEKGVLPITQKVRDAIREARENATQLADTLSGKIATGLDAIRDVKLGALDNSPESQRIRAIDAQQSSTADKREKDRLDEALKDAETDKDKREAQDALNDWALDQERKTLEASVSAKQDAINKETDDKKIAAERQLAALNDQLRAGSISTADYNKAVLAIIGDSVGDWHDLGSMLGTSFVTGFGETLKDLFAQVSLIGQGPGTGMPIGTDLIDPFQVQYNEWLKKREQYVKNLSDARKRLDKAQASAIAPGGPGGKATTKDEQKVIANAQDSVASATAALKRWNALRPVRSPGMAMGGIISGALGRDRAGVYRLSAGEGVMRRSAMEGMQRWFEKGGKGGEGGVNVHFHGPVIGSGDERSLARELARIVQPALNRRVALS